MMDLFLFLSIVFFLTFIIGRIIEKIRVPWIFAALILGAVLAVYNPFADVISSPTFTFLAQLGMYLLLFMIGLEIDLKEMRRRSGFILRSTLLIISLEAFFGTLVIHTIFGYSWLVSLLVAASFATVGEAILIPILQEFKIVNTSLGQAIIGVGTLDDLVEVLTLILAVALVSTGTQPQFNVGLTLATLFMLFIFTIGLSMLRKQGERFAFLDIETLFLLTISLLFFFLGVGEYAESTALAALLAGIGLKTFLPENRQRLVTREIKTVSYGLFSPLFFLWVGASIDINYLLSYPLLVLLVVFVSNGAKLLGSYIAASKELGKKNSVLMGIGLSVRFSTSIVVMKILLDGGIIGIELYSVIIASSMVFKFIIPVLFSNLISRWKGQLSKAV